MTPADPVPPWITYLWKITAPLRREAWRESWVAIMRFQGRLTFEDGGTLGGPIRMGDLLEMRDAIRTLGGEEANADGFRSIAGSVERQALDHLRGSWVGRVATRVTGWIGWGWTFLSILFSSARSFVRNLRQVSDAFAEVDDISEFQVESSPSRPPSRTS